LKRAGRGSSAGTVSFMRHGHAVFLERVAVAADALWDRLLRIAGALPSGSAVREFAAGERRFVRWSSLKKRAFWWRDLVVSVCCRACRTPQPRRTTKRNRARAVRVECEEKPGENRGNENVERPLTNMSRTYFRGLPGHRLRGVPSKHVSGLNWTGLGGASGSVHGHRSSADSADAFAAAVALTPFTRC